MKIPSAKIENFVVPAKDEGSERMKSVWLDVEGERLLATNGHMAMRLSTGVEEGDVSGLVPVEAFELSRKELKAIIKATDKGTVPDPWLKVTCGEDAVVIHNLLSNTTHLVTRPKLGKDETFPNVDAVFPQPENSPSVTMNIGYIADIMKSLEPDSAGVSMWVRSDEQCVLMATETGKSSVVLMPMRSSILAGEVNQRGQIKNAPVEA